MIVSFSKIINKFCFVFIGLLIFSLSALAEDNVISSVVISKAKDKPDTFELSIDSTMPVDFKENKEDSSMVYFDLKNSILAENAGVIYDDVVNIDNVVVKQIDKSKVRIYVKGVNVKNTELIFINSLFDTKEKPKKIVINRPINEYKSIDETESEDDLESQDEIQEWDDNSFNFSHLITEIFSGMKKDMAGIIGALLLSLIIMGLVIKNAISKIYEDTEPLIGLNHAKEHDKQNYGSSFVKPTPKQIRTEDIDFENIANRNKALREAQAQLSKAHNKYQEYLQNKYKTNSIKDTSDMLTRGIALNQYKKSNENPYLDQEVIKMRTSDNLNMSTGSFKIPPRPKISTKQKVSSPYIQKTDNVVNNPISDQKNQTSLKFLESVTKIYEQSGREDLAIGLKNSISKTKQRI